MFRTIHFAIVATVLFPINLRADVPAAAVAGSYPQAREAMMPELNRVSDPLVRARTIAQRLAQRNPDWSWRWGHVEKFVNRLSGKPGFEKTLMLLGSDNLQVRNGAFRTLLYAQELEAAGVRVAALNTPVTVPGLGLTDVDILLSDGTPIEVKSSRLLRNTPQLRTQLEKLATLAKERGSVAGVNVNSDPVLLARGHVEPAVRDIASHNGFRVLERTRCRDLVAALEKSEVQQLQSSARGVAGTLSGGRSAGTGVGTSRAVAGNLVRPKAAGSAAGAGLFIVVLEGGATLYLQLTGQINSQIAVERYGETATKAIATSGAIATAVLLGANPVGITVIVTGLAVYVITDAIIDALRPYYHSSTLTVLDINAALPDGWEYRGGIDAAMPRQWSRGMTGIGR